MKAFKLTVRFPGIEHTVIDTKSPTLVAAIVKLSREIEKEYALDLLRSQSEIDIKLIDVDDDSTHNPTNIPS